MFGVVYKAVHKDTGKAVAIKEIDTELIPTDKLSGVLVRISSLSPILI